MGLFLGFHNGLSFVNDQVLKDLSNCSVARCLKMKDFINVRIISSVSRLTELNFPCESFPLPLTDALVLYKNMLFKDAKNKI